MKGQGSFILALVFALIVAIFAVINVDAVEVNYLFGTGKAPLILVILGSVLMGGVIAGAFGMVKVYKLQRANKALNRKVMELEKPGATTPPVETVKEASTSDEESEKNGEEESKEAEDTKNPS